MNKQHLRVGLTQLPNNNDLTHNTDLVCHTLRHWASHQADLVVYPECMLTGFSARPPECTIEALEPHLDAIHDEASALGLAVVLPSIVHTKEDEYLNAGWVLKPDGTREMFNKQGLTESEQRFFSCDEARNTRVFKHKGATIGLVLCREICDVPHLHLDAASLDLILWPSYWHWDTEERWEDAQETSGAAPKHWRRPLLQINYSQNAASMPQASQPSGQSVVVNADNQCVHQGLASKDSGILVHLQRTSATPWSILECVNMPISWHQTTV